MLRYFFRALMMDALSSDLLQKLAEAVGGIYIAPAGLRRQSPGFHLGCGVLYLIIIGRLARLACKVRLLV